MDKERSEGRYSPEIGRLLIKAGMTPNVSGFDMLGSAVAITMSEGQHRRKMVGDLYPTIARIYGTTPAGVERNIRTVITKAWVSGTLPHFYAEHGIFADKKPSNSIFISQLSYAMANGLVGNMSATE